MASETLLLSLTKIMESTQQRSEYYSHQFSTSLNPLRPEPAVEHIDQL